VFPGAIGFPEQEETDAHLPAFREAMRARRFDLAIQLHGSGGVANDIVAGMGADIQAGFLKPDEPPRAGVFVPWPDALPEILRCNALMDALGVDARDTQLEIPLTQQDSRDCDALMERFGIDVARLIIVHAGAQLPSRRWPAERFAQVAAALACEGWQIALTGSPGEAATTSRIAASPGVEAIDLTGHTALGGLAALVARARLIVCNDTGLSHVAAAVRTKSVVVASGSDTSRWAPLDCERHRVLADYPPCRPCAFRECPYGHPCALNVSVDQVLDVVRAQLSKHACQASAPSSNSRSTYAHR
jgi:ADP-heptose:LPS heptosyltransferase